MKAASSNLMVVVLGRASWYQGRSTGKREGSHGKAASEKEFLWRWGVGCRMLFYSNCLSRINQGPTRRITSIPSKGSVAHIPITPIRLLLLKAQHLLMAPYF